MRAGIFALLPMTETIETSLVYIHSLGPTKKFVGCGALIEGGYIATCRHVWRDAADANGVPEVEIEYPCSYEAGNTIRSSARLADPCEETGRPSPDLVLLHPAAIPSGVMALQLAAHDRFETGAGFAYAHLARFDPDDRVMLQDIIAEGSISPNVTSKGRQFTGAMEGYWFSRGSIAEMRAHAAEPVVPSNDGADIEAAIGASRDKLRAFDTQGARDLLQSKIEEEIEARTRRLVPLLKERAAVERLALDYEAATATLAEIVGLAPYDVWVWIELGDLWRVTGASESEADAYENAKLAAERTGSERDLSVSQDRIGDMLVTQGDRDDALAAYRAGLAIREALARRDPANTQWQRDLSVSQSKIGDVLVAQGDRDDALAAYRAGLAIAEALARRDPQYRMAARPLGQPEQDRRRAGGAGRPRRCPHGLPGRARRHRSPGPPRPGKHRMAARSDRLVRESIGLQRDRSPTIPRSRTRSREKARSGG
jgi:tetratricopeptide (TPR) repeat protein